MSHKTNLSLMPAMMIILGVVSCTPQTDGERAQDALTRYFSLLHQGRFAEAAELYGGQYDVLADWNPAVDPNDHAALLEMGCTINGLQCLPLKGIRSRKESPPDAFEFIVQFENADGSVFALQALDASTDDLQPASEFKFTVVKNEDGFTVQELPVYVP